MARSVCRATAILVACLTLLLAPRAAALASGAAVSLSPTSGPPTTAVRITGSGFHGGETVSIDFDATLVKTTTASSTGAISMSISVPRSAQTGNHTVTARGQTSGLSGSARFLVGTNWPQFGFSARGGRYNPYENTLGRSNMSGLALDWSANIGITSDSSPAVASGMVFVDGGNGVYALNFATGHQVWFSSTMGGGDTVTDYMSPAYGNGLIYAIGGDNRVYAFDAKTGATHWTFASPIEIISSPTVAGSVVYITSGGNDLYALNAATGARLWTFVADTSIFMTPAVANGAVYFESQDGVAYAVNANTGAKLWKTPIGGIGEGVSMPVYDRGVVFMPAAAPYPSTQGEVVALNPTTGARLWTAYTPFYSVAGLTAAYGLVYASVIGAGVYAYNETTGALVWAAHGPQAGSAPAVANGVVYAAAGTDAIYAFDAKTGQVLAQVDEMGRQSDASPAVANGVVYTFCRAGFCGFHLPGRTP